MGFPYIVTDQAIDDYDAIANDLSERASSVELGARFYRAVETTIALIAQSPLQRPVSYHSHRESIRHRLIEGFGNHIIFYDFDGETVRILRVFHAAMDLPKSLD